MNLAHGADCPRLNQFHATAEIWRSGTLIAGLRHHLGFICQSTELPGFGHAMREWFFTVNVLVRPDGGGADAGMPVIGCRNHHCVERLFLFKKFAIIPVRLGAGQKVAERFLSGRNPLRIHIAQSDNVLTSGLDFRDQPLHLVA